MLKMIEVFKTNINTRVEADAIQQLLKEHFPESFINFDLEDRENILRFESSDSVSENVIQILQVKGFYCEELF